MPPDGIIRKEAKVMKNVIKEIFIMLLIIIVLVLVFGILFYDYVPVAKVIPNSIQYKIPEEIAKELGEFNVEENAPLNIVYEVTATDLTGYEKGKINPFASSAVSSEEENGNNSNTGSSSSGKSTTSTNATNSSTTTETGVPKGTFFDNGTTK